MNRKNKKAVCLIVLGIAVVGIPFLLRMRQEQDTQMYVKEFEEEKRIKRIKRKTPRRNSPYYQKMMLSELLKYRICISNIPFLKGQGTRSLMRV